MITIKFVIIAEENGTLENPGILLRAAIIKKISRYDPQFARKIHTPKHWGLAPYSIRPIKPANITREQIKYYPQKLSIYQGKEYDFEITILDKEITQSMLKILTEREKLQLGSIKFHTSYITLQKYGKIESQPQKKIQISFQSPTYFKSKDRPGILVLLPLPELIVASAARIWNKYICNQYNVSTLIEKSKKQIKITAHKLRTIPPMKISKNRSMIGFIGKATYEIVDNELAEIFTKLIRLAEITNIGGSRTAGFGVIKIFFK